MADFSRPLHRNHASSATLSKKLSNVHSFSAKSMYDDVFASPSSKLKTRTFSGRVEDYSEIFNSSNSSSVSSIPVLDLPAVDKRDGLANVPNTESDYSNIFGGFNDIDIGLAKVDAPREEFKNAKNEDCSSGEAWIPTGTSPSEADTDCQEKNQVHSQDATYQSVDCKKQFKMSYHKTNIGIRDGTNGTTHIAQFHAVPAFTCVIDEITPLQKTEGKKPLASINDVNSTPDVGEGLMEGKHCRKASSNLSDSGSEDVALNRSYSSGMQSNAYDIDVNAHLPKVTPCSSPTPNFGNNNDPSEKGTAAKYGTHESDEFESATDETPIFSDEEVDTNSVAAASAAAVRKAIEMAQANIRLAKEAMERRKGLQSSVKHSSKNGLKVKEAREIKIAAKAMRLKEKKGQEIREREKTTIQNFPCTDGQNARTGQVAPNLKEWKNNFPTQGAARETNGKPSEMLPVMQDKLEGQRELEAAKLSRDSINTGKFKETTLVFEEDNKEMLQTVDGSDRERWKTTMDTFELSDSDGKNSEVVEEAFEVEQFGRKLNAVKEGAQEWENHANKLKLAENIYEPEKVEKKLKVALNQVEAEGKLKASQDQETCEEELTETQEELVEKENESTTKKWEHHDYEKGVKESQNQLPTEMKLNQAREGEKNEKRLEEDYESKEKERKLKELLEQEIYERRLKACECLEDEKKPTASCELEVNKNSRDAHTGQDFKRGLKTVQDQELRVYGHHGETRLKEDIESERYEKIDEAWKQEKNDNILEEVVRKEGNEREEEEAYKWEDSGLKQRHPYQREEDEKNVKAAQESLTIKEKDHQKTYDECKQAKSKNLSCAGETYRHKEINDNVETTEDVLAHEESWRMVGTTKAVSEPEENEEGSNAVEVANELADRETLGKACLDRDAIDVDDDQITNNIDDDDVNESKENENESEAVDVAHALDEEEILETASLDRDAIDIDDDQITNNIDDDDVNESKGNENELEAVDVAHALDEEEILETASLAEDELEQNDIEKSIKDEREAFLADGSGSSSDEANMNTKHEKNDQNNNGSGFACNVGAHVEKPTHELGEFSNDTEEAKVFFDQVEEIYLMKAAYVDKQSLKTEKKIEASELNSVSEGKGKIPEATQDIKTSQTTEQMKENLKKIQTTEEREAKESMRMDTMLEKEHRNRDEAKEKERERERERGRLAVERAVREARERAYAEARERAEKTAMEKATAEARQRVQTDARERLDKAAAGTSSLAAKVSMEAKVKAERAAVERATAEARERALEKALSEKAAFEARDQRNTGMKRTFSSSDQSQGSGPSSSYKHSNTSNHGVPSATERFDDGAVSESAERCKARLEKHQQIVERAAKALEEKNKRDLLAQKEQAERNRFAAVLDADVKRWSSGKAGNLRALLSTLQYILGPDSGWQPIPLTDIVATNAVKKAYRKATLFVHPDKLQQRRASIQQKYICEKVFDLLKEAWDKLNSEER